MHPGELSRGPASSHATWSANSLIDQNAALWASLRPPARPSWPVLVRQRVSELSFAAVGERLHHGLPRWFDSRQTAQRWLLSATGGIALGLALGLAARFSESPPPELDDPPIAVQRVAAAPVSAAPVSAAPVSAAPVSAAPVAASPPRDSAPGDAPASGTAPTIQPDAPALADPAPAKRAAVAKKKKLKATSKRRTQKTARKRQRALTSSR